MGQPTIIAGINFPGISGGLPLAHSAIGISASSADMSTKVVDSEALGGLVLDDDPSNQREGTAINILFTEKNVIFNDNLKLKIGTGAAVPIISNILDPGSTGARGTVFSYPQQNRGSIITLVYRNIPKIYTRVTGGTNETTNYRVWMAINANPVLIVDHNSSYQPELKNINDLVYQNKVTVELPDISLMTNIPYDSTGSGILEVIPVESNYIIQRLNANGHTWQRRKVSNYNQNPWIKIQDSELLENPFNFISTPPQIPDSAGTYQLTLEVIPPVGCGTTTYVYDQKNLNQSS